MTRCIKALLVALVMAGCASGTCSFSVEVGVVRAADVNQDGEQVPDSDYLIDWHDDGIVDACGSTDPK